MAKPKKFYKGEALHQDKSILKVTMNSKGKVSDYDVDFDDSWITRRLIDLDASNSASVGERDSKDYGNDYVGNSDQALDGTITEEDVRVGSPTRARYVVKCVRCMLYKANKTVTHWSALRSKTPTRPRMPRG